MRRGLLFIKEHYTISWSDYYCKKCSQNNWCKTFSNLWWYFPGSMMKHKIADNQSSFINLIVGPFVKQSPNLLNESYRVSCSSFLFHNALFFFTEKWLRWTEINLIKIYNHKRFVVSLVHDEIFFRNFYKHFHGQKHENIAEV